MIIPRKQNQKRRAAANKAVPAGNGLEFTEAAPIAPKTLQRWLKKAGTNIGDYRAHFTRQKELQRKAAKGAPDGEIRHRPFHFCPGAACKARSCADI